MTYDELATFGRLRKEHISGPYGMFQRLMHEWTSDRPPTPCDDAFAIEPREVADKVKRFLDHYAIDRHKITTLIPSLDCNSHRPEGNRFVMRSFVFCPSNVNGASKRGSKK